MLRVGVLGAAGRMGRAICAAVQAEPGLELVAAVDPAHTGETVEGLVVHSGVGALAEAGAEVAVDFTVASAALANASWCSAHGVHVVLGTTGLGEDGAAQLAQMFQGAHAKANCIMAPNFAIGAVLMMRFAELAAPWFETVEIIELHHDGKVDAPSGTAALTAQRISAALSARSTVSSAGPEPQGPAAPGPESSARGFEAAPGVRIQSVRLRGLVAHQEVLLGSLGQILTIRHDSVDRASFMPGVLLAARRVPGLPGLTVGIEALLGL